MTLVGAAGAIGIFADLRRADVAQLLDLLSGKRELGGAEIVGELFARTGAEDHGRHHGLRRDPGKGNLRHAGSARLGDLLDRPDDVPRPVLSVAFVIGFHAALRILAEARRTRRGDIALVLAGEPAAPEWRPRQQAFKRL